jgi:hypothetical protein
MMKMKTVKRERQKKCWVEGEKATAYTKANQNQKQTNANILKSIRNIINANIIIHANKNANKKCKQKM